MADKTTIEDILKHTRSFMLSKVILLGHQFNLYDLLSGQSLTLEQIIEKTKNKARGLHRLLDALTALGVLEKEGCSYTLAPGLIPYLTTDGESSVRSYLELINTFWYLWSDMDIVIRDGEPIVLMMDLISQDRKRLDTFINAMDSRAKTAAALIPGVVDISGRKRMLDIGAGPGTYSFTWMKLYKGLRSTLIDLESVLAMARKNMNALKLTKRTEFQPGDFTEMLIEGKYDLVLLANVLQMYGPDDNARLIHKCWDALDEGGMIVIHGYTVEDSGIRPLGATMFALSMAAVTRDGGAYKKSEKSRWLEQAGFKDIEFHEIDADPSTVITAMK